MLTLDKLWNYHKKHDVLGCEIGDGCACFVDKLLNGKWKVCKLNQWDVCVFKRILPENVSDEDFKTTLAEMLATYERQGKAM